MDFDAWAAMLKKARERLALEVEIVFNPKLIKTLHPIEVRRFKAHRPPRFEKIMDHEGKPKKPDA